MGSGRAVDGRRWLWDSRAPLRWLLVDVDDGAVVAACADIDGLFVDTLPVPLPDDSAAGPPDGDRRTANTRPAALLGCSPEPVLRRALDALAAGAGNPGGAMHRRRINAQVFSVANDGTTAPVISAYLQASVTATRPSPLGEGLIDVWFDAAIAEPMPTQAREIWDLWHRGRPTEPGHWVTYDADLRHQWTGAALAHHRRDAADKPADATYHLDGRDVTDIEGFYCAIGEAINGPGGYFGWNADALHDCLRGEWGARTPFTLVWHDSAVARERLRREAPAVAGPRISTFEQIAHWLTEDGVTVELR